MKILAIIPARSGSKGLLNKNIKDFCGKPLVAHTIQQAIESNLFDEIMVSTDSELYANVAMSYGAKVPFLRSKENSDDHSSTWDSVYEVLMNYQKQGLFYDVVVVLQPTSPLRQSKDIINAFQLYNEMNADYIVGVCQNEHSMFWMNILPHNHSLKNFIKTEYITQRRQELPNTYRINGAIYVVNAKRIIEKNVFLYSDKSFAYIMDKINSIDIDDEIDFIIGESIYSNIRRN